MSEILKIENNILYKKDRSVWAYYLIKNEDIMALDIESKNKLKLKSFSFLSELKDYKYLELKMIPITYKLKSMLTKLSSSLLDETQEVGKYMLDNIYNTFSENLEDLYEYKWVLGVCLQTNEKLSDGFFHYFNKVVSNFDTPTILDKEKELYSIIYQNSGKRLSSLEIRYYMSLAFGNENLLNDVIDEDFSVFENTYINFEKTGLIEIDNVDNNNYKYATVMSLYDTYSDLENNNFFEEVQKLPYAVSLNFLINFEELKGVNSFVSKVKHTKNHLKEIESDNIDADRDITSDIYESKECIDELYDNLVSKNVETYISFTCTAFLISNNLDYLKNIKSHFVSNFSNMFRFYESYYDQYRLFNSILFGNKNTVLSEWLHTVNLSALIEMLPFISKNLGTKTGFYIGKIDNSFERSSSLEEAVNMSNNLVFFNPLVVNKGLLNSLTDSPHIAISGETGKGKSFLTKYIHMYCSLMAKTLYIDPKREYREKFNLFFEKYKNTDNEIYNHLKNNFQFVTIDPTIKDNFGVLDPILFLNNDVEIKNLCENVIKSIYTVQKDKIELAIIKAISCIIEKKRSGEVVGFFNVLDELIKNEDEEIKNCGLLLKEKAENSILSLLFSYGESNYFDFSKQNTILEINNLDLPKTADVSTLTSTNIYSLCVMYAIGKLCEKFGLNNAKEDTIIIADECWIFQLTEIGRAIFNSMRRIGRSYNNMLIYTTQSINDFNVESDGGNFGSIFVFDEPKEREKILQFLNLDVTDENKEYLEKTIKGQCLYLDNQKRVGKLSVHCIFDEFLDLFKTVDKNSMSILEEVF